MNAKDIRGKRAGNSCLYRDRVQRSFLRRNIEAILDAHELLLTGSVDKPAYELMVANERRKSGWDFPTPEMLADLVKGEKPMLIIGALQFRELKAHGSNRWMGASKTASEDGLEWLPNSGDLLRLPCALTASIFEVEGRRPVYIQTRSCTVVGRRSGDNSQYFNIVLEKPFLIELSNLFAVVEAGTSGARHWKRTINAKHTLELVLQCNQSKDNAELLSLLEAREISHYDKRPAKEGRLKITWAELPECPENGRLLPLQRTRGHKLLSMAYGVEIDMGWQRKRDTPLQRYNRYHEAAGRHLKSTAPLKAAKISQSKKLFVRYNLGEGDKACALVAEGLKCIWCDRSPVFASIMRLMHHYLSYHDHFAFHFDGQVEELQEEELISITIGCESGKRSALDLLSEEHNWVAPDKPFDLTSYVNGDKSWVSSSKGAFSKVSKGARGQPVKPKEAERALSSVRAHDKRSGSNADVADCPPVKRKRHIVPRIEGVTFYHSQSKLPMKAGEELSESEDEIYDTRLTRSQRRDLTEYSLPPGVREFHLAFNHHMDAERPGSTVLIKDGIVRFVRKYNKKMSDNLWLCELQKKLKHLQTSGVLCEDVVTYCLQLAENPVDHTDSATRFGGLNDTLKQNGGNGDSEEHPDEIQTLDEGQGIEGRAEDANCDSENADAENAETPPGLRSQRGRFIQQGAHSGEIPSSRSYSAPQRQKKKPHRWSGKGTDREIIANGYGSSFPNDSPSKDQEYESKTQHRIDSNFANLTLVLDGDPSRPHQRYRWQNGDFRPHGDISESPEKINGFLSKGKSVPHIIEAQNENAQQNGEIEDDSWTQSVAHRHISCSRSDAPEHIKEYLGYEFVKDEISEHADKIRAEHLDFNKFIQRLHKDLNFDASLEELVCSDHHDDGHGFDEHSWQRIVEEWQSGRCKLVFEVRTTRTGPTRSERVAQNAMNGTCGPQSHSRRQSQDRVKRGVCICGQRAEGGRGCIGCENIVKFKVKTSFCIVLTCRRTAHARPFIWLVLVLQGERLSGDARIVTPFIRFPCQL